MSVPRIDGPPRPPPPRRQRSAGNARAKGESRRRSRSSSSRHGRSKSRECRPAPRGRYQYDTPFDEKGRCHYHVNVQLAAKKMMGGWKVLQVACPKCMEREERSVRSGASGGSGGSRRVAKKAAPAAGGDTGGEFDANGCCVRHAHIQVAKKKLLGGGWKVLRICPSCDISCPTVDLDEDSLSLKSGRSKSSPKSKGSAKSGKEKHRHRSRSRSGRAGGAGRASPSSGALPFDGDGYCCRHPGVQIAQKKLMGGFKILHEVCPACADEGQRGRSASKGRCRSSFRCRSSSRRRSSSRHRGRHDDDRNVGGFGPRSGDSASSSRRKIRVKNLRTEDERGNPGRYSGYVDDEHRPNGDGVMRYEDDEEE